MPAFELKKTIVLSATMIVDAIDGTDAARKLFEWKPDLYNARDGEQSSQPWVDPDRNQWKGDPSRPYEVRSCRGHFHVMVCGEDIIGSYSTEAEAQAEADRCNAEQSPRLTDPGHPCDACGTWHDGQCADMTLSVLHQGENA